MRDAGEEGGEVSGVEVGFEMELDVVTLGDGKRAVKDVDDLLLFGFGGDAGLIDEGKHHAPCANACGDRDEFVEMLFAGCAFGVSAADEREVHEPVAAERGRGDVVFALEGVEFGEANGGEDGVGGVAVVIVDPLDVVEAGGACASEFFSPGVAREGLEAVVFRWAEAALHDTEGVHRGRQ